MAKKNAKVESNDTGSTEATDSPTKTLEPTDAGELSKADMVRAARDAGCQTNEQIRQFVAEKFDEMVSNSNIWSALNGTGERKDRVKKGGLAPDDLIFLHRVAGRIGANELAQLAALVERVSASEVERYIGALNQIIQNGTDNK